MSVFCFPTPSLIHFTRRILRRRHLVLLWFCLVLCCTALYDGRLCRQSVFCQPVSQSARVHLLFLFLFGCCSIDLSSLSIFFVVSAANLIHNLTNLIITFRCRHHCSSCWLLLLFLLLFPFFFLISVCKSGCDCYATHLAVVVKSDAH